MLSQYEMFYKAARYCGEMDETFFLLVKGDNPITMGELRLLINNRPIYARYKPFLKDDVPDHVLVCDTLSKERL